MHSNFFLPKTDFSKEFFNILTPPWAVISLISQVKEKVGKSEQVSLRVMEIAATKAEKENKKFIMFQEGYVKIAGKEEKLLPLLGEDNGELYAILPDNMKLTNENIMYMSKLRSIKNVTFLSEQDFARYLGQNLN